jgi:hypothetical protein
MLADRPAISIANSETRQWHPLAGLLDPLLGAWLARNTPREVTRIKQLLEREPSS